MDMSEDVKLKDQVISEMNASPMFSIQLNKSTDVTSYAKLLVFVSSCKLQKVEMFCSRQKLHDSAELQWKYVCGVCTDGAPVMMESRSGFPTHEALLFHMSARCLSKEKRSKPRF